MLTQPPVSAEAVGRVTAQPPGRHPPAALHEQQVLCQAAQGSPGRYV